MPDAPAEILYGYVTAAFTKLVQDTNDVGDQPQLENLNGKVRIEAVVPGNWLRITLPGNKSMTTLQNQEYSIINGKMAAYGPGGAASLVAGFDNPYVTPSPFQYRATFVIDDMTVQPPAVLFSLHPGETIELTDIISMPPAAPIQLVVSTETATRAETAAAEAEAAAEAAQAIIDSGIGPAVEAYLIENPPEGSGLDTYADVQALSGYPASFPIADSAVTNVKVASNAAISLDKTVDGSTRLAMTSAERTKLASAVTTTELPESVQDIVGAMLTAGTAIALSYNDAAGTLSITSSGADAEAVRDAIGVALVGVGGVVVTVNDASDTITLSLSGIAQSSVTNLTTDLASKAPLASPTFTGTVSGVTKAMVGLSNVDDTSDADKPVSNAQATAIAGRVPTVAGVLPRIKATALNTWPDRATWIAANYAGYSGDVEWDSLAFATQSVAPPLRAGDRWWKRSA